MKSSGYFVLGGLLSGVGQGLVSQEETNRQNALLALKRQYDVEDRDARIQGAIDLAKTNNEGRKEIVQATGEENRKTENVKLAGDLTKIDFKGKIDFKNDTALEALKHKYNISEATVKAGLDLQKDLAVAGATVDHWETTTDGRLVAFNKKGDRLGQTEVPGTFQTKKSGSDDDEEGSISGEQSSRGAPAPAAAKPAAAPAKNNAKADALARLGNIYAAASQDPEKYRSQYPGMFDANGKLLPKEQLIARVNQRYGS